jgi:hypothetical protein
MNKCKPEIVMMETGRHNKTLDEQAKRIIKGGSWKKQRIITLVPADEMISSKVYLSHRSLIFPPNNPTYHMLCVGMEVGDAYSSAIESILSHSELSQWEYLLTLEHDNIPPIDGVIKLLETMEEHKEFACVGGLYWTKGEGGVPQIWGDPNDPVLNFRPQVPIPNTVQECCGTGMGFNLWRLSMFKDKKLRKPWFKTVAGSEGVGTQDLYAWNDFRKHGYRCAIDTRVLVGHYDHSTGVVW